MYLYTCNTKIPLYATMKSKANFDLKLARTTMCHIECTFILDPMLMDEHFATLSTSCPKFAALLCNSRFLFLEMEALPNAQASTLDNGALPSLVR